MVWLLAFFLGALCCVLTRETPEKLMEQARQFAATNRFGEAERSLRRILALEPTRTDARLLLGKLGHDRNDWATVASAFRDVPDSDPMAGAIRVAEGDAWLKLNRAVLAEDCWTRATRLSPEDDQPRMRLIYLYGLQLRRAQWLGLLWNLYDRDQVGLREMVQLMIAANVVWEADEAAQDVRRFAVADAADIHSRRALGEYLLLAGRISEAIQELESLLQAFPDHLDARLALVECHLARADKASARKSLDQMPESAANDYRYWKSRGSLALLERRFDDSVADFTHALAKAPFDRELHHKLSQSLRIVGSFGRAEHHAQIADKLARIHRVCHSVYHQRTPSPADIMHLVQLCAEVGLIEEALGWIRVGEALVPRDAAFLAARNRLSALPQTSIRHPAPESPN